MFEMLPLVAVPVALLALVLLLAAAARSNYSTLPPSEGDV
jgi:hypothetical protein